MTHFPKKTTLVIAVVSAITTNFSSAGTTTPTSRNVPVGTSSSVSLVWNVPGTGAAPVSVSSTQGTFRNYTATTCQTATTTFGTIPVPIASTAPATSHTFQETILVPADITTRAQKLGLTSIGYHRNFAGSGIADACIELKLVSAAASGLNVNREELSFDTGTPVKIVPLRESLYAKVTVGFTGTGLIQGVWEVATPPSTSSDPIYSTVAQIREYLALGDIKKIDSPALPTNLPGIHLVRFRITDPVPAFDTPVIRYFVGEGRVGHELPANPMNLVSPAPSTLLARDTFFVWEPIKNAKAYQLEIYKAPEKPGSTLPDLGGTETGPAPADVAQALAGKPVTGMLINAKQTRLSLSPAVREHLTPGRTYFWRVLAVGSDGAVIGESPVREIKTP
jgi:hypothetical protein